VKFKGLAFGRRGGKGKSLARAGGKNASVRGLVGEQPTFSYHRKKETALRERKRVSTISLGREGAVLMAKELSLRECRERELQPQGKEYHLTSRKDVTAI